MMARARGIKPGFFKNEDLGTADPFVSLLFAGLWVLADKAGILEDRPLRIKAELFPYRENFDINGYLTVLVSLRFIHRYEVDGLRLIQVTNFEKHQHPHHTEKDSEYPKYTKGCKLTVKSPLNTSRTPSDSLNTDSLNTDSLNTDSLNTDSLRVPAAPKKDAAPPETNFQAACKKTWAAYNDAYFDRYGTEPVRNAQINSQVKNFVKRLGHEEAPHVAGFYVRSNSSFYVQRLHSFGNLVTDAEKVRTEWATGRSMTATRARQIDKTQANFSVVEEALALMGENYAKTT